MNTVPYSSPHQGSPEALSNSRWSVCGEQARLSGASLQRDSSDQGFRLGTWDCGFARPVTHRGWLCWIDEAVNRVCGVVTRVFRPHPPLDAESPKRWQLSEWVMESSARADGQLHIEGCTLARYTAHNRQRWSTRTLVHEVLGLWPGNTFTCPLQLIRYTTMSCGLEGRKCRLQFMPSRFSHSFEPCF